MAQSYDAAAQAYGSADALYDAERELDELTAAITGRRAFSYNPSADPMYRNYAGQYVQNGRLAMRDTMGQAAALTGGYGSSYAQGAGQQRYDEYLRSLGEVLPELYGMAYRQYTDQGAALQDAYDMAFQRRETAYARERDRIADERYAAEQQAAAAQTAFKQMQTNYANLVKLISTTGYKPKDKELQAAGLSRAQAEALRNQYLLENKPGSSGGGGGGRKSSSKSTTLHQSAAGAERIGKAVAAGVTGLSGLSPKSTTSARSGKG